MCSTEKPSSHTQVCAAQSIQNECALFWHGVVESFGVEWKSANTSMKATSGSGPNVAAAVQNLLIVGAALSGSTSSTSPVLQALSSDTHTTHGRSPLHIDTTAFPSPATPSSVLKLGDAGTTHASSASFSDPPLHVTLMPPWRLVEYDPKLWVLLRKNLLANLALAALTVAYAVLSDCLAATPSPSSSSSSSVKKGVVWWWLRMCLWAVKYMGQWPFYTVLQIIGLVWFSQLYRETWLVRKGWVLRGTSLCETSVLVTAKTTSSVANQTFFGSTFSLPPLSEGVPRPWLASQSLGAAPPRRSVARAPIIQQFPPWCQVSCLLLHASTVYCEHAGGLVLRMLRHKGPTVPLQEWILGDAVAAAAFTARQTTTAINTSPPRERQPLASPDIFERVVQALESTSEVIFKAFATMSFALCASCIGQLPIVGTPLCLLLNAQLYAFYVFDYRYATQQQPDATHYRGSALTYQLRHFEKCWAYYTGYGAGSAVLSHWLTHHAGVVVSMCAMSVLYSWQVVWSGFSVPLPSSRALPIFSLWFYAVDMMQKHHAVLWRSIAIIGLLYIPFKCFFCV